MSMISHGCNRARERRIGAFLRRDDGVAAIEFALIAPLLVTLMLGALEITQSIWTDGKVEQATNVIGDLVSRTPEMTDAEFVELGYAGPLIMRPSPQNDLKFTVTSVKGCKRNPDSANSPVDYYVIWSRVWEGGTAKSSPYQNDTKFTNQPETLEVLDGDTLIVSEGIYTYEPPITRKVGTKIEMGGYAFHQPRDRTQRITYAGVENAEQKTCDDYRGG